MKSAHLLKTPTGIRGLDEVLNGGVPSGELTLLSGDPGTTRAARSDWRSLRPRRHSVWRFRPGQHSGYPPVREVGLYWLILNEAPLKARLS